MTSFKNTCLHYGKPEGTREFMKPGVFDLKVLNCLD